MGANPYIYNIATETELAEVLSHYNTDYVLNILTNAINGKFNPNSIMVSQPNLVSAWEINFKQIQEYYNYPEFIERIKYVRDTTYKEIIRMICRSYNLNFTTQDDDIDWYTAATMLYDFFVCNFNRYLIQFFSTYIYRERSTIYEDLNLASVRKSKDSTTTYGKRLYKDIKLVVINTAIDQVVSAIMANDISLTDIFTTVLPKEQAIYMDSIVSQAGDFFKESYGPSMNSTLRPVLLTEIRFALQKWAGLQDEFITTPVEEE